MRRPSPCLLAVLAAAALLPAVVPAPRAVADDEAPAAAPAEIYEVIDRKKTMSMKLPRSWKAAGEHADPNAIVDYGGFFGEAGKSDNGTVKFFVVNRFARASMARAVEMPKVGPVTQGSVRQGPGWAEACAVAEGRTACWRRFVEKNGHVFEFQVLASAGAYDRLKPFVEKLLDTATIPGEYSPQSLGAGWKDKKSGEFDVTTDADADREKSIAKATSLLAASREAVAKALAGKPFDAGRPVAWIFQNGQKFEDRGKAAIGVEPTSALFSSSDRCAMVSIISENAQGHEEAVYRAGAAQYAWQYFGGEIPLWLGNGLANYGEKIAISGGKGKLTPTVSANLKKAVAAGKRRLDQWFDLASWNEVTDNDQGMYELFGWIWYFRNGPGARKYKKQFDGYLQALRDTGDPSAARKSFDNVNFDEMLQDFKAAAAELK